MAKTELVRFKKLRFYVGWPFAVFLFLVGRTSDAGFLAGGCIILAGEALRIWSQGSINKGVRLADSGPYAYVRNPLYISNFLLGLGFIVIFSNLWASLAYIAGFTVVYHGTVLEEEAKLASQYGEPYERYCRHVPRFFPSYRAYAERSHMPFDWKLVWRHGEYVTFFTILLLFVGLYLRQEWFQNAGGFYSSHLILFWFGIAVAGILVGLALYRKFKRSI